MITMKETSRVLYELRKSTRTGVKQKDRTRFDARAIKASEEDFRETNLGICEELFSKKHDGEMIHIDDIEHLQREFHEDLWHYQFHTLYPNDAGRITTPNYLKSNLPYLTGYEFIDHKNKI